MPKYKKNFYLIILGGFICMLAAIGVCSVSSRYDVAVSVVMPVYNSEKYVSQSIISIIGQSLKNIELIIVDDGSTDKSLEIINRYAQKDSRIKVYKMPKNSGAAVARNEGLKHVRGKYVLFVDSDDWLHNDALYKTYHYATILRLDIVMFLANIFDEKHQQFKRSEELDRKVAFDYKFLESLNLKVFSYKDIPDQFFLFTKKYPWNKLIRTSLIKKNHLYFDNVKHHNDSFFITMALVHAKRISYLKEYFYNYRVNREGAISQDSGEDAKSVYDTLAKIKRELIVRGYYPELRTSLNYWIKGWERFVEDLGERIPEQAHYLKDMDELIE